MARVISLDKWDVMIISPLNRFIESVLLIIFETSTSPVESSFNISTTTIVTKFCMSYLRLSNDEFVSAPNALFIVLFAEAWVWVGGMTDDKVEIVVEEKRHNRCRENLSQGKGDKNYKKENCVLEKNL